MLAFLVNWLRTCACSRGKITTSGHGGISHYSENIKCKLLTFYLFLFWKVEFASIIFQSHNRQSLEFVSILGSKVFAMNKYSICHYGWNTTTQPFSMLRICNVDAFTLKILATADFSSTTLATLHVSSISNLRISFVDLSARRSNAGLIAICYAYQYKPWDVLDNSICHHHLWGHTHPLETERSWSSKKKSTYS